MHYPQHTQKLIETNLFCTLNKRQFITIPKVIRNRLHLEAGSELTISMLHGSKDLLVQKPAKHTLENIMVLSNRGTVRIPQELKRYLCLQAGDLFHIYLSADERFIVLKYCMNHFPL